MKKKNPNQPEKASIDEIDDEVLDEVVGGKKATKKKATRSFKAGADLSKKLSNDDNILENGAGK